jgi:hypothetical protein
VIAATTPASVAEPERPATDVALDRRLRRQALMARADGAMTTSARDVRRGGMATELLGDRAVRILPLTDLDAAGLVRSLRASPLLFGYRGSPPVDVVSLEQVLQRVARLAARVAEIAELDINPLIVSDAGAVARRLTGQGGMNVTGGCGGRWSTA